MSSGDLAQGSGAGPDPRDAVHERVEEALDDGRVEDALRELDALDEDDEERLYTETFLYLRLGDLATARRLHDRLVARPDVAALPNTRLLSAQLLLAEWRVDEARALLERLDAEQDDDADVLEELALCAELAGDLARADRLYARAQELVQEPPIPRLSERAFDAVVSEAIEALPAPHRAALELAEVIVEPMPSLDHADPTDLGETPPGILGLFIGASELERDPDHPEPPPRIFLFQRNIERGCAGRDELRDEIRTTFMHELAHLLGFDEDGVAELGLE